MISNSIRTLGSLAFSLCVVAVGAAGFVASFAPLLA